MHERPKDAPPKAAELLFSTHWPHIFLFYGSNLSASCIASFILHSKDKANVLETTAPPQTRPVNLLRPTMKTTYFQDECTFKPPEQRFKRRAFYLARHLLLAFALKNSKILQSWFRIQRIAPVLINRCLRHFPMQCGFSANRRNTESKNVFAPAQTSTQKICKGTRSDNVINQ